MFLRRRRQCVEAGFHLTYISFARLFLLKMARNPWCSESRTRWVCSTFGKSSVRKGIRDSLKQTRKIALQIREKEKYEASRVRRFKQAWNEEFPWVKFDEIKNYMFCAVCQKHPSVCDKSSSLFGYWLFIIHLFSSWHLSQPQPICFGSFFFFGRVDFVFGQPKSAKYLSNGQVKWKKRFLPCHLQI